MPARSAPTRPSPPELDAFLGGYAEPVRSLAREARNLVLSVHPDATEKVWPGWKVVGYGVGAKMTEMVCGVAPYKGRVGLTFQSGAALEDPDGLLDGGGKRMRSVSITSAEQLRAPGLRTLLASAFAAGAAAANEPRPRAARAGPAAPAEMPCGDDAVRERTGRGWAEWIAALDEAGAAAMPHAEIARLLGEKFGVRPWWAQQVTVGYERARQGRATNQAADGYQVGVSRTIAAPAERVFAAWMDDATRRRWLGKPEFTVSKATEPRSIRIKWGDGSRLDVMIYPKGEGKSQLSVDHRRISDPGAVEPRRAFWKERLDALRELLENGTAK